VQTCCPKCVTTVRSRNATEWKILNGACPDWEPNGLISRSFVRSFPKSQNPTLFCQARLIELPFKPKSTAFGRSGSMRRGGLPRLQGSKLNP
jgi:hypothetical protein